MSKAKEKSGISLIVLVITIIVIIILAVAVILSMSQNNPISNANEAVDANDLAVLKEAATVAYAKWYTETNLNPEKEIADAPEYVDEVLETQGFSAELRARVQIETDGKITIADEETDVAQEPVIPNGFEHVEGTVVETGYVIKNSTDNNEFVWVPVEVPEGKTFNEVFVREEGYRNGELDSMLPDCSEPYTSNATEVSEYNAMKTSVEKYGGFYIGRYEASENATTGKTQSIANQWPYDNIAWGDSMTEPGTEGAVGKSRAVYLVENATQEKDAVSTLIYGVQWDATVRWLKVNYPGIERDSSRYGNYDTGSAINTGSNPNYALNNIYDMAGNEAEWTMEVHSTSYSRILRSGFYSNTGADIPVSGRVPNGSSYSFNGMGFRLALYIK